MILEVNLGSLQIELDELSVVLLDIELDKVIKEKQKQPVIDEVPKALRSKTHTPPPDHPWRTDLKVLRTAHLCKRGHF